MITPTPTVTPPSGHEPHAVIGRVFNADGSSPETLIFKANIVGRDGDIIDEGSSGSSYADGGWQLNTAYFATAWAPGDVLHVNFLNTGNRECGSWEYALAQGQSQEVDDYYLNGNIMETCVLKTTSRTSLNMVTLLDSSVTTADDFAQQIPNCTVLYKWIPESQSYSGHITGRPINNFAVQSCQPYFASLRAGSDWTQNGVMSSLPYYHLIYNPNTTSINWIVFPPDMIHLSTAEDLAQDIGVHCKVVYKWLVDSQSWSGHIKGRPVNNFKIKAWEVYLISVDGETYWP